MNILVPDSLMTARDVALARRGRVFARLPDLNVLPGRSIALTGASGCGKTTALMALACVRAPFSGVVRLDGADVWKLGNRARDRLRGTRIGLVFQSLHLVTALTVEENLLLAARCAGLPAVRGRAGQLLAALGLSDIGGRRSDRISQGQAQRVAIARALFNRPAVILADEPTSALDDRNAFAFLELLQERATVEGAGLVVATHDRRILNAFDAVHEMETVQ